MKLGETVWVAVLDESGTRAVRAEAVVSKATAVGKGHHSPVLTHGTFPVVDGIVTAFDSLEKMTLASYAPYIAGARAASRRL